MDCIVPSPPPGGERGGVARELYTLERPGPQRIIRARMQHGGPLSPPDAVSRKRMRALVVVLLDAARDVLVACLAVVAEHSMALVEEVVAIVFHCHLVPRVRVPGGEITAAMLREACGDEPHPIVFEGVDVGLPRGGWTGDTLARLCGDKRVSVHVSEEAALSWCGGKNFVFEYMGMHELIARVWAEPHAGERGPYLYLRSVGEKMRTQPADLRASFPNLATELKLPSPYGDGAFFSSALRVSSAGMQLWTHNDMMDNLLVHLVGVKRVTLWPPGQRRNLHVTGSSSPCRPTSGWTSDWAGYSSARGRAVRCVLRPGDVLFIPPLWFHHVVCDAPSASVNVFFRGLPADRFARKDLYGNGDLPAGEAAVDAVRGACKGLSALPSSYARYYTACMAEALEQAAEPVCGGPRQAAEAIAGGVRARLLGGR